MQDGRDLPTIELLPLVAATKRAVEGNVDLRLQGKVAIVTGSKQGHRVGNYASAGASRGRGSLLEPETLAEISRPSPHAAASLQWPSIWRHRMGLRRWSTAPGSMVPAPHNSRQQCRSTGAAARGFASVTDDQWWHSWNVNLMVAVRMSRAALPMMLERGKGAIVTISSVNAFLPDPAMIDCTTAKAALTNFSKALSKEVGPRGIRVNTVSPGPVETPLWLGPQGLAATVASATGVDPETAREQIVASQGGFPRPDASHEPTRSLISCCCSSASGPRTHRFGLRD